VFRTGDQLLRACLEDTVMAKLHGITMGLDVCATFHMGIEPAALQSLTETIVEKAAPAYLMSVAGNADPMLGYLTTSFRQHPKLRGLTNRKIASVMSERLIALGVIDEAGELRSEGAALLYAVYQRAGGETRSLEMLRAEGSKKIAALREQGFDLGYGWAAGYEDPPEVSARLKEIYSHARHALYSTLDEAVLRDASPGHTRIRTRATDRDDYIAHPPAGEAVRDEDAAGLRSLYSSRRPRVQIVISDGLNANALNENLRPVLPALRRRLAQGGHEVGATDLVIDNGRVRAGYHIGALLNAEAIIHLIGERPGTGLNTMSAYVTYGSDQEGRPRWGSDFDHSWTTAICGIHLRGKPPETAVAEIARVVDRMFEEGRSGVALGSDQE
jgi:ethanolamine ammonia-lyase large subunit